MKPKHQALKYILFVSLIFISFISFSVYITADNWLFKIYALGTSVISLSVITSMDNLDKIVEYLVK